MIRLYLLVVFQTLFFSLTAQPKLPGLSSYLFSLASNYKTISSNISSSDTLPALTGLNSQWVVDFSPDDFLVEEQVYYSENDTTIAGKDYYTLYKIYREATTYMGAYRSTDTEAWFVPADSSREFLLQKYDVEVGDTVKDVLYKNFFNDKEFKLFDIIVSKVQEDKFLTYTYKRIDFPNSFWTKSVGAFQGFFNVYGGNEFTSTKIICQVQNGVLRYNVFNQNKPCKDYVLGIGGLAVVDQALIYPNPSTGLFTLELANGSELQELQLFDAVGKNLPLLYTRNGEYLYFNLSTAPAGMYYLQLTYNNGASTHSKLLLQNQ